MSPKLKEYYRTKQRRMAFYIVENELYNKENPPEVSAIIGLDKELEAAFYAARRPPLEKSPSMSTGMKINRIITSNRNKEDKEKKEINKRHGIRCPSLPTQWKNNLDVIIPKAEFGPFVVSRKVKK